MRRVRLAFKIAMGGVVLCIAALIIDVAGYRYELSKFPPEQREIMADQDWLVGMSWVKLSLGIFSLGVLLLLVALVITVVRRFRAAAEH